MRKNEEMAIFARTLTERHALHDWTQLMVDPVLIYRTQCRVCIVVNQSFIPSVVQVVNNLLYADVMFKKP